MFRYALWPFELLWAAIVAVFKLDDNDDDDDDDDDDDSKKDDDND